MRPAPLEPARACLHPDVIPDAPDALRAWLIGI